MEGGLQSIYPYYNSIIQDGRRIRRMRRTQLSAEKLRNSLHRKKGEMQITRSTQKQRQISKSRSIPKIQQKKIIQQKGSHNKNNIQNVQRQYYTQIKNNVPVNNFSKKNSKNDSNSRSGTDKLNFSRQLSNSSKSRNIQNSFIKTLKQNYKQISLTSNQQKIIYVQQCLNCKNSQFRTQKLAIQRKSNSKQLLINKSQNKNLNNSSCLSKSKSRKKSQNISNNKKLSNQIREQMIDQYGFGYNLESKVQKSNQKSKLKQKLQNHNSELVQNGNKNIGSGSKISIRQFRQSKRNSEIISNRSQDLQSSQRNKISTNSKLSQNRKKQQYQIKNLHKSHTSFQQFDQILTKQVSNFNSLQPSNFSKLKIQTTGNPIINSSSVQQQNWKDAIKSLTQLDSSNNQIQNQFQPEKTSNNFYESKRISLKLDSMREDNYQNQDDKNSDKFLSMTSKDINQRKILGNINSVSSGTDIGSLKGILQSIQIHDFIINLINQFKEETYKLGEGEHETQLLCFLLERKYFLEKSNIVKALKGGKNIFKLSSIQIPTEILKKYLDTPEIKNIIRNLETEKVKIFKQLQKNYHQLKIHHKNNSYFQFQTPNDTFSKQIVRILNEQVKQLYNQLQNTQTQDQQQLIQSRIFQIMEQIFLLSQLHGRPVKKIQFIDEITDFQTYYKQNQPLFQKTVLYFQNLK